MWRAMDPGPLDFYARTKALLTYKCQSPKEVWCRTPSFGTNLEKEFSKWARIWGDECTYTKHIN